MVMSVSTPSPTGLWARRRLVSGRSWLLASARTSWASAVVKVGLWSGSSGWGERPAGGRRTDAGEQGQTEREGMRTRAGRDGVRLTPWSAWARDGELESLGRFHEP